MDSRGIPGWKRVDNLAQALIQLSGLSISNAEAKKIQELYAALSDFDKKPLLFCPRPLPPARGRFARAKRVGHTSVEYMKR